MWIFKDGIRRENSFMPRHGLELLRQAVSSQDYITEVDLTTDDSFRCLVTKLSHNLWRIFVTRRYFTPSRLNRMASSNVIDFILSAWLFSN